MNHVASIRLVALSALIAASSALADKGGQGGAVTSSTTVGPVTAAITAMNFDESGAQVNGLLVGTNVLLTFPKGAVCGGVANLGVVGDSVTYSGKADTFASGLQRVRVTSFTNGTITFTPPTAAQKTAFAQTEGTVTQLNYGTENGNVNGFVFTPTAGAKVFVDIKGASATLVPMLTVGATVSVTGTLDAPPACAPTGTISEVDASSITIGTTTFPIGGQGGQRGQGGRK